jgi:hypothetical protein
MKQCFLVCQPSGNMATKLYFLVGSHLEKIANFPVCNFRETWLGNVSELVYTLLAVPILLKSNLFSLILSNPCLICLLCYLETQNMEQGNENETEANMGRHFEEIVQDNTRETEMSAQKLELKCY